MSSGAGSSTDGARGKKGGHKGMGSSSSGGVDHTRRGMYEEFVKGIKKGQKGDGKDAQESCGDGSDEAFGEEGEMRTWK